MTRPLLAALAIVAFAWVVAVAPAAAAPLSLEDLTTTELRDRIAAGTTTVLVPIGGTEQSGPWITLGKHNVRVRLLAQRIAERLGDAVVAPVIAYVPEGAIDPPTGHMRFPGTISIPTPAFEAVLEGAARSLCRAGLRRVVFLGDHGDYQQSEAKVAAKLDREGSSRDGCRVFALLDYYRVTQTEFVAGLVAKGFSTAEIGSHAGLADTALTLALDPSSVRRDAMAQGPAAGPRDGVHGDPRRATAALGVDGVDRIVAVSVARIRALSQGAPAHPNP